MLSIDVMDSAGEHQNNIDHDVFKTRIDKWGVPVATAKAESGVRLGNEDDSHDNAVKALVDPNYCGSCYGGVAPESGCCNTCDEVRYISIYVLSGRVI